MRVSLAWLREFIDLPTEDPEALEEVFASLGHEVDAITRLEVPFHGVVVARVDEVRPHPNADKVRLCRVTTPEGTEDVVCGAWNFEAGAVVPLARPGAVLSGGLEVGVRAIRGVTSHGMICSAAELGLGDDHERIMVLDPDLEIGSDFAEHLPFPDTVITLDLTPNRPDVMSMLGVARELSAYYRLPVREPQMPQLDEHGPASKATVTIEDAVGCPRFVVREVRGITSGPSPLWMQLRLVAAGMRPISNIVDVTNYVMIELGQPLHGFDLDEVAGESLIVRRAAEGERVTTLDGVDRLMSTEDMVVADPGGAQAIAGVMGGARTEMSDATTRVLIEGAHWNPESIMVTSIRHGLRSEASARFSRGVDPNLPDLATARAAELMVAVAGGTVASGVQDVYPRPIEPLGIDVSLAEVRRILGIELDAREVGDLLDRLRIEVSGTDPLRADVPTYRPDLTRPIDLIEEIARIHGYDRFPETLPSSAVGGGMTVPQRRTRLLREVLVGAGYTEAPSFSFIGQADLDRLGLPADDERRSGIALRNPLREEEGVLRTTLLPGLLKVASRNVSYGTEDVAVFEVGRVFVPRPSARYDKLPHQPEHLGFVAVGGQGLSGPAAPRRTVDAYTATGLWHVIVQAMGLTDSEVRQAAPPAFHPGRAAEVVIGGEVVGALGELHPAVARSFGLQGRVAAGEVELAPLVAETGLWELDEPSTYPPVVFDLALVLDEDIPAARLLDTLRSAGGRELESVALFDEFRGSSIGEGRKSLAVRVVLRAPDRTLTDEDMAPIRSRMIDAAAERLNAELRGGGV